MLNLIFFPKKTLIENKNKKKRICKENWKKDFWKEKQTKQNENKIPPSLLLHLRKKKKITDFDKFYKFYFLFF